MRLLPIAYEALPCWRASELTAVWPTFLASCRAAIENLPELRRGVPPNRELTSAFAHALRLGPEPGPARIEQFFRARFRPMEALPAAGEPRGFVTGYYEPELEGALAREAGFEAPVLGRPSDLVDMRGVDMDGWDRSCEGARRTPSGALEPYPDRAAIESGAIQDMARPIVWLRDHVEVFFAQVQGSARVRLRDGRSMRLVYAGRNGRPYSSIGRALIEAGDIAPDEMSLARCKAWLRANGQEIGSRGRNLMQRNRSYVFFRLVDDPDPELGPVGGQGLPLTAMRSAAVDRTVWPYGTPVWIAADLSDAGIGAGPSGRLMIAQDTGSAIVGPARADLFIGAGDKAGAIAGLIRHSARFIVFSAVDSFSHGTP